MATSTLFFACAILLVLTTSFIVCPGEEPDCSLYATYPLSKYLDCPLVTNHSTDIMSGGGITNEFVNVSWQILRYFAQHYLGSVHINRHGIQGNDTFEDLRVTNSGQLYIPRVRGEMRQFIFECTVWDGQWSQTQRLQPLRVLHYDPFLSSHIPEDSFRAPMSREAATLGADKLLCMQGEILTAQVQWTKQQSTGGHVHLDSDVLASTNLAATCFECECMADWITANEDLELISDHEGYKYVSFTATGYYKPYALDVYITSLECHGIPNWFLSVLLIRNISLSDAGNYEVEVHSNTSDLQYTSIFTLNTGYLQIPPTFHHEDRNDIITESLSEGSTTYYLCTATITVSSSLLWKKLDSGSAVIKHVTPNDTPLTLRNASDLCQLYAEERAVVSLMVNSSIVSTSAGLMSQQTAALVICNMEPSLSGVYQCVANSSQGEAASSGPQISVSANMDNVATASPLSTLMVVYITAGSVLVAFLLLSAVLLILITYYSCLRYKSQPTARAVMPRERVENIYHEIYHPGEGAERRKCQ